MLKSYHLKNYLIYWKLLQCHGFQVQNHSVMASTHMLTSVCQSIIEDFVAEIHHDAFLYLLSIQSKTAKITKNCFYTVHCVERKNLNFGLHVCRIFLSCYFYQVLLGKLVMHRPNEISDLGFIISGHKIEPFANTTFHPFSETDLTLPLLSTSLDYKLLPAHTYTPFTHLLT